MAQVEWFQKMKQEKERDLCGGTTASQHHASENDKSNNKDKVSSFGALSQSIPEIQAVKSRGNGFNSVNMQPIMESIGEEDQYEMRFQS